MNLQIAHARAANILTRFHSETLKPEMKVSLLARHPGNEECEFIVTDDDLAEIAAVVRRAQLRERRDQHDMYARDVVESCMFSLPMLEMARAPVVLMQSELEARLERVFQAAKRFVRQPQYLRVTIETVTVLEPKEHL